MALGEIADPRARLRRRPAEHGRASRARAARSPRIARISVDFPAPFGPSTAMNSPSSTVRSTSLRISPAAEPDRDARELDRAAVTCPSPGGAPAAIRSSCATCHCSKLSLAGSSVSVIVTVGMCAAAASAFRRWIAGVVFCEL